MPHQHVRARNPSRGQEIVQFGDHGSAGPWHRRGVTPPACDPGQFCAIVVKLPQTARPVVGAYAAQPSCSLEHRRRRTCCGVPDVGGVAIPGLQHDRRAARPTTLEIYLPAVDLDKLAQLAGRREPGGSDGVRDGTHEDGSEGDGVGEDGAAAGDEHDPTTPTARTAASTVRDQRDRWRTLGKRNEFLVTGDRQCCFSSTICTSRVAGQIERSSTTPTRWCHRRGVRRDHLLDRGNDEFRLFHHDQVVAILCDDPGAARNEGGQLVLPLLPFVLELGDGPRGVPASSGWGIARGRGSAR